MEKMRMESVDMTAQNIDKIGALFPNCVTEAMGEDGKLRKAINFDLLRQMLSGDVVEGDEAYEFTWVGKKAAIVEANKPIRKTLRPCPEESKDWDTTENLYIEGDNLEVLKLLQESYLGKIKLIYIDPPYNTGSDFIYRDDYSIDSEEYQEQLGLFDEHENRLFKNTDSNGRFHSDWCSMIYARLLLAKNLLSKDGAIFISIDDHELFALKQICDEVFGARNYISTITRPTGTHTGVVNKAIVGESDYILVYAKELAESTIDGLPMSEKDTKIYDMTDEHGRFLIRPLRRTGGENRREDRPNMYFPIEAPDGTLVYPIGPTGYESRWICNPEGYEFFKRENRIYWKKIVDGDEIKWQVYQKFYLEDKKRAVSNLWSDIEGNKKATRDLRALFENEDVDFDFPKPTQLLERIINIANDPNAIILDFFSGSATTAHATMKVNNADGGKRKFIMVQLPEATEADSRTRKAGYATICDIGKERIRRAGDALKAQNPLIAEQLDIGFRVFRIDETNMNPVFYSADEYSQDLLADMVSNIKEDRTELDLLFGCLLDWGLSLSEKFTMFQIDGINVYAYGMTSEEYHDYKDHMVTYQNGIQVIDCQPEKLNAPLIACFAENVPEAVIKRIAKMQPLRAVFRDSSFANSPAKINVGEIFKLLAPDTRVKVI